MNMKYLKKKDYVFADEDCRYLFLVEGKWICKDELLELLKDNKSIEIEDTIDVIERESKRKEEVIRKFCEKKSE